jgi:hypothetical protein
MFQAEELLRRKIQRRKQQHLAEKRLHISGPGLRPGDVQKISLIIFYP